MTGQKVSRNTGDMGIRRYRTLAVCGILALLTSTAALLLYRLPLPSAAGLNRLADYRVHADLVANARSLGFANAPDYEKANGHIALIAIDDESLAPNSGLPRWPFPRGIYGALLKKLSAAGAKAVAFDVDFVEPSADPRQDAQFASGARRVPTVAAYQIATTSDGHSGAELPPPVLRSTMSIGYTSVDTPGGFTIGQPIRIGHFDAVPGSVAKALSLAAVEAYTGKHFDTSRIPTLDGEMLVLPFGVDSTMNITQRAGAQDTNVTFVDQTLSIADAVKHDSVSDLHTFANGRIVLIGATAQAFQDVATTMTGKIPGVYVHARLVDQILTGRYITPAPGQLDIALIIVLPLLLAGMLAQFRPLVAVILAAAVTLAYVEVAIALFVYKLYWLDILHVAGAMVLAALAIVAYRVVGENAQRRTVTSAFGLHVSPAVVNEILKQEGGATSALAGKRAKTTIFYSDIRGFTSMSEKMSAEAVYEQLNEYFEAMCEVIFTYGGYVDKFIGDCIMAIFSAPNQTPDDARKAVEAALDQQDVIAHLAQSWQEQGKQALSVGMGINTGYVVMGNLGSQKRMNYTVIGDDVNVAARLYNVAKGGQIIISESTYEEVKEFFIFNELEPVSVKGKSKPLRTYEVLARKPHAELIAAAAAAAPAAETV
jgi:class 3 adenylate cyclase/CHASE2 domain-containing sensor protein